MATLRTVTVGPGRDYTSLAAAEAAEQADLVTLDRQLDIVCYAMQDTTPVVIDGWTTDATRYIRIVAAAGAEAKMPYNTSTSYRLEASVGASAALLRIFESYTRVERIQLRATMSAQDGSFDYYCINHADTAGIRIVGCVVRGDLSSWSAGSTIAYGIWGGADAAGTNYYANNLVFGFDYPTHANAVGIRVLNHSSGKTYCYNNTIVACGVCMQDGYADVVSRNNITAPASGGTGFSGSFDASSSHNASTDATTPGASSRNSQTFGFVDSGTLNYHLTLSDGGARGFGTDLSGDANFPIAVDFDNATRSGSWDIGADQTADSGLAATASDVATASAALTTAIRLGAVASDEASASAAVTTAIRLAMGAVASAAASGALSTGIRLSAAATGLATAQGAFAAGAVLEAAATDVAAAVATLATGIRLSGIAQNTATATGALTNWASVTLAGSLYTGPGGVLDPNFWVDAVPTLGTTLYYDAAHITIYPNAEISSDSNDCTAVVQFFDGTDWAFGLIVITPHMAAHANGRAAATAQLSAAIQLAAAASALATATGAFSTGAGLTASASDTASASGSLSTAIPLSALADGVSTAVAALIAQIKLIASAASLATATGSLNSAATLNAAALAVSTLTGSLSTSIEMQATAAGQASGSAALGTGIKLAGAASDVASAAGALSSGIALVAQAIDSVNAAADLTTTKPLTASAIDVAIAIAVLSTGISLRGNAAAVSAATADLSNSIQLLAGFLSESRATAVLTDVIQTPPIGVYASDPRFVVAKTRWSFFGSQRAARFERKYASEKAVLTFDFSGVLQGDETLGGPITLTIEATSGTDANAIDVFSGYPAYDMTKKKILLPVKSGVPGCFYYVSVAAGTTNQHKSLELSGLLAIAE